MPERKQIFKCEACGNIIEVLHGGAGDLVCCGENMIVFEEKTADEGKEKHVPVLEQVAEGVLVVVGSKPHPMEEKHYIEWIEVLNKHKSYRHYLNPGEAPESLFESIEQGAVVREYCSVHGLWKS